jgi:hypothetical protein
MLPSQAEQKLAAGAQMFFSQQALNEMSQARKPSAANTEVCC